MTIEFPANEYYIATSSSCIVTQMSAFYTCNSNGTTGIITITQMPASEILANTDFSFTVNSIRNPGKFTGF